MKNRKIKKIVFITLAILIGILLVVLMVLRLSKLKVERAPEAYEKLEIGNIELSSISKVKLNEYSEQLGNAYKIKKISINNEVKSNIENYIKNTSLDIVYEKGSIFMSNHDNADKDADFADLVFTEEQIKNAKELYKDTVTEILRILDIEDVYNMDELKVGVTNFITFTDKDGNVKDNQPVAIDFYSNMKIDSKYESDGHPPQICISINSQGKLETLRYTYYEVKKINKEYEFKTFDEIRADIQNENNVVVDFVYGEPIEGGVENWQDITINDIEVVMDCPSDNKNFNNIVPYYVMTGYNKRNDEITITMPAIKNKYLYATEGLKEDMKRIAKKILGRD